SQYFPAELFSDPCWEMLLDLYDAALAGAEVTVTSLGAASGVPQTTALRRMETLQGHNLIVRAEDKSDKRRTIIRQSETGMHAVDQVGVLKPRLVLIDYNLPDLAGMTVAERVRRLSPQTELLLMSGRIDGIPDTVLREAGVLGFLNKPIPLDRLRQFVRKSLR